MPDLSELYLRSLEKPQELTLAERFRLESLITYIFSSFQIAIDYHQDKLLSDEALATYSQGIRPLFEQAVVTEWWEKEGQHIFGQSFRDVVLSGRSA